MAPVRGRGTAGRCRPASGSRGPCAENRHRALHRSARRLVVHHRVLRGAPCEATGKDDGRRRMAGKIFAAAEDHTLPAKEAHLATAATFLAACDQGSRGCEGAPGPGRTELHQRAAFRHRHHGALHGAGAGASAGEIPRAPAGFAWCARPGPGGGPQAGHLHATATAPRKAVGAVSDATELLGDGPGSRRPLPTGALGALPHKRREAPSLAPRAHGQRQEDEEDESAPQRVTHDEATFERAAGSRLPSQSRRGSRCAAG